jgi:hypothetical protein
MRMMQHRMPTDKLKGASVTYAGENFKVGVGRVYQDGATAVAEVDATSIGAAINLGTDHPGCNTHLR